MTTTATTMPRVTRDAVRPVDRSGGAYFWLLLFIAFYVYRPEDWIPGLHYIPLEKITGTLALLSFAISVLTTRKLVRTPPETYYLILLFVQFCLTIPFAYWPGGAFQVVFFLIIKVVMISLAAGFIVDSWPRLRRLLFIQASGVSLLAAAALLLHRMGPDGRLGGPGANFDNPNDFALLITVTFPFCLAFLLSIRNPIWKGAWAFGIAVMGVALVLTASRVGFLTIVVAGGICLWQFGVKGRRPQLIAVTILLGVAVLALAGPGHLARRLGSTFSNEDIRTYESTQLRWLLFKESLLTAIEHPLFGVGPGNFQAINGTWKEAHNSFTEIPAEAGFPALILFLLFLSRGFANLRKAKQFCQGQTEQLLLIDAMQVSLVTFVVGAAFTTWEYQYFVYLMVAYTTALVQITTPRTEGQTTPRLAGVRVIASNPIRPRWNQP